jgi:hypothetical protein
MQKQISKESLKAKMFTIFSEKIEQWLEEQEQQTDGFEYERSYVETIQDISKEVFQMSLGAEPKSKNQKKNFTPVKE